MSSNDKDVFLTQVAKPESIAAINRLFSDRLVKYAVTSAINAADQHYNRSGISRIAGMSWYIANASVSSVAFLGISAVLYLSNFLIAPMVMINWASWRSFETGAFWGIIKNYYLSRGNLSPHEMLIFLIEKSIDTELKDSKTGLLYLLESLNTIGTINAISNIAAAPSIIQSIIEANNKMPDDKKKSREAIEAEARLLVKNLSTIIGKDSTALPLIYKLLPSILKEGKLAALLVMLVNKEITTKELAEAILPFAKFLLADKAIQVILHEILLDESILRIIESYLPKDLKEPIKILIQDKTSFDEIWELATTVVNAIKPEDITLLIAVLAKKKEDRSPEELSSAVLPLAKLLLANEPVKGAIYKVLSNKSIVNIIESYLPEALKEPIKILMQDKASFDEIWELATTVVNAIKPEDITLLIAVLAKKKEDRSPEELSSAVLPLAKLLLPLTILPDSNQMVKKKLVDIMSNNTVIDIIKASLPEDLKEPINSSMRDKALLAEALELSSAVVDRLNENDLTPLLTELLKKEPKPEVEPSEEEKKAKAKEKAAKLVEISTPILYKLLGSLHFCNKTRELLKFKAIRDTIVAAYKKSLIDLAIKKSEVDVLPADKLANIEAIADNLKDALATLTSKDEAITNALDLLRTALTVIYEDHKDDPVIQADFIELQKEVMVNPLPAGEAIPAALVLSLLPALQKWLDSDNFRRDAMSLIKDNAIAIGMNFLEKNLLKGKVGEALEKARNTVSEVGAAAAYIVTDDDLIYKFLELCNALVSITSRESLAPIIAAYNGSETQSFFKEIAKKPDEAKDLTALALPVMLIQTSLPLIKTILGNKRVVAALRAVLESNGIDEIIKRIFKEESAVYKNFNWIKANIDSLLSLASQLISEDSQALNALITDANNYLMARKQPEANLKELDANFITNNLAVINQDSLGVLRVINDNSKVIAELVNSHPYYTKLLPFKFDNLAEIIERSIPIAQEIAATDQKTLKPIIGEIVNYIHKLAAEKAAKKNASVEMPGLSESMVVVKDNKVEVESFERFTLLSNVLGKKETIELIDAAMSHITVVESQEVEKADIEARMQQVAAHNLKNQIEMVRSLLDGETIQQLAQPLLHAIKLMNELKEVDKLLKQGKGDPEKRSELAGECSLAFRKVFGQLGTLLADKNAVLVDNVKTIKDILDTAIPPHVVRSMSAAGYTTEYIATELARNPKNATDNLSNIIDVKLGVAHWAKGAGAIAGNLLWNDPSFLAAQLFGLPTLLLPISKYKQQYADISFNDSEYMSNIVDTRINNLDIRGTLTFDSFSVKNIDISNCSIANLEIVNSTIQNFNFDHSRGISRLSIHNSTMDAKSFISLMRAISVSKCYPIHINNLRVEGNLHKTGATEEEIKQWVKNVPGVAGIISDDPILQKEVESYNLAILAASLSIGEDLGKQIDVLSEELLKGSIAKMGYHPKDRDYLLKFVSECITDIVRNSPEKILILSENKSDIIGELSFFGGSGLSSILSNVNYYLGDADKRIYYKEAFEDYMIELSQKQEEVKTQQLATDQAYSSLSQKNRDKISELAKTFVNETINKIGFSDDRSTFEKFVTTCITDIIKDSPDKIQMLDENKSGIVGETGYLANSGLCSILYHVHDHKDSIIKMSNDREDLKRHVDLLFASSQYISGRDKS